MIDSGKKVELLDPKYDYDSKDGVISKGCRFDILAKTKDDITINIEMQYYIDSNIKNRLIYYSDRLNAS